METIEINGAILAYRIVGHIGPLLITLHGGRGFGTHASDYAAYSPLADVCRVLSFDFRGHGQSSVTPPFTFAQIVDDIEALRAKLTDEPAIICGGSFGGMLAQQYALTYPQNTLALILRGTAPSHHRETWLARARQLTTRRGGRSAAARVSHRQRPHGN
jgi:pimeloyl-ACP methyl ester carboxylesterase